jgi:hypothetical protein
MYNIINCNFCSPSCLNWVILLFERQMSSKIRFLLTLANRCLLDKELRKLIFWSLFFETFSFPYVTLLNNFQSFTIFEYYLRKFWYFSMGKPNKLSWTRCSKNSDQKINFRNSLSERHLFAKVNKNLIFDDICLSNSRITQLRQEGNDNLFGFPMEKYQNFLR